MLRSPMLLLLLLLLAAAHACIAAAADAADAAAAASLGGSSLLERIRSAQLRWPEALALIGVALYIAVYVRGRRANQRLANAWWSAIHATMAQQFGAVGAYTQPQPQPLYKDSEFSWKVYASGRRNCSGVLATVLLKQRHDLLHVLLALLDVVVQRDHFVLDVPMEDGAVEPFVLVVCRSKDEKRLRKEAGDIERFARPCATKRLPPGLVLLAESPELELDFLDQKVAKVIANNVDLIDTIHVTDSNSMPDAMSKASLRFKFLMPKMEEMDRVRKLVEMAMFFVDKVAMHRLSPAAKKKALAAREKLAEQSYRAGHEQRQEMIQKRRDEALRREEDSLLEMSAEAQMKYEKRQQKINAKRRAPKMKMLR